MSPKDVPLENVVVSEKEYTRLSVRDPSSRFAKAANRIRIRAIHELKQLIGVPDSVAKRECGRRFESPAEVVAPVFESIGQLTAQHQDALRLAAREFIYGNSETVAHYAPALDKAIGMVGRAVITVVAANDIIVERNATLELDGSVDVIVANKVLVKQGGQIRVTGPVKIDCESIEGEELTYTIGPITPPAFSIGLRS
jgi:hypothetical protein